MLSEEWTFVELKHKRTNHELFIIMQKKREKLCYFPFTPPPSVPFPTSTFSSVFFSLRFITSTRLSRDDVDWELRRRKNIIETGWMNVKAEVERDLMENVSQHHKIFALVALVARRFGIRKGGKWKMGEKSKSRSQKSPADRSSSEKVWWNAMWNRKIKIRN